VRIPLRPQPELDKAGLLWWRWSKHQGSAYDTPGVPSPTWLEHCRYGAVGDRLYVREVWALEDCGEDGERIIWKADRAAAWCSSREDIFYLNSSYEPRWLSPTTMRKEMSRLQVELTGLRIERLNEIKEEDIYLEGVRVKMKAGSRAPLLRVTGASPPIAHLPVKREGEPFTQYEIARAEFASIWDEERERGSWKRNPYCFVGSFKLVKADGQ
jgi:hypothetical protein